MGLILGGRGWGVVEEEGCQVGEERRFVICG